MLPKINRKYKVLQPFRAFCGQISSGSFRPLGKQYNKNMNKKIIIISVVVFLVLAGGGYYYWTTQTQKSPADVLPGIDTGAVNPLQSAQSANPYEKTNPFSDIKVNPFK